MGARLIKKQSIEDYVAGNARSKSSFEIWLSKLKWASWEKPSDIVTTYNSSDILGNSSDRVVFNIGGNKYRLICKYQFWIGGVCLYIKWIGTHAEYTKLCKENKQCMVDLY